MELHTIYILIGVFTLILNLTLTLHIIRGQRNENCRKNSDCEEVITFRLTGAEGIEDATTAAAPCDDTLPLE